MRKDTEKALALLTQKDLTCAICRGENMYESRARGVAPLLNWLDNGMNFAGFCAADKVVGAGAAYLYALLGIEELYAAIISDSAQKILTRYGISVHFGESVPRIRNREGDGFCPIETAVADAVDPADALARIRARLAELKK
ncbi:MAG: DUF1893 domain-containing protein [Clostridia bacterium]|nr:DUF1893 domain-containing protein [Clostridia bacterium]